MLTRLAVSVLALFLRRSPTERGRWRLVPLALRWSRAALPADCWRRVRTRDGFRLRVRLGDWIGGHVYVTGDYEPPTKVLVQALLTAGDTFLDVGANIGYFTLLGSRCVGPAGQVYAFEPVPATRDELLANVALNRATNIVVRGEALADAPGEATFFLGPQNHRGTSSLRALPDTSGQIRIHKARLDDLLPPGTRVRLIKIDVEGAEYLVLRGMEACLRRDQPDLIVEVTDEYLRGLGHTAEGLCELLFGLGYRMYIIDHPGLRPVAAARDIPPGQYNALFTARSALPAGLAVLGPPVSAA